MFHFIENLQHKPPHARKRFAFFVAISITAVVLLVWLSALPARLSETPEDTVSKNKNSPFSLLGERIGSMKKSLIERIGEFRGAANAPESVEEMQGEEIDEKQGAIDIASFEHQTGTSTGEFSETRTGTTTGKEENGTTAPKASTHQPEL